MRDSKNLLLILVSVGLMGTWVYHLYDKSFYSTHKTAVLVKDTLATQEAIRDSLRKLFDEKAYELDTMKAQNNDLETERARLNGVLTQLNDEMKRLQQSVQQITEENKQLTETISQA